MNFKAEQERFDVIKWYDSIVAGEDRCGSYEFCGCCNKEESEPCARAEARFGVTTESLVDEELCVTCDEACEIVEEQVQKTWTPIAIIRLRSKKE